MAPSSYSKNTTSLPDLLTNEAPCSRTWPKNEENPVPMTAKASYAPHRRSAENHTLFTWQLVIDAERDTLAWECASFMLGPLNIYERQINVKNTQLLVTITRRDTRKKDKPKLSFKIISQNHDDLRLHIEKALAIKTLKLKLNKCQEEMGTGFLPWTLSQLLLPSPNASFTPLTVHSLLLSHLLTPILLTPLHNNLTP